MSIESSGVASEAINQSHAVPVVRRLRKHGRPASMPKISLYQPGRLRVSDLQALFSISHTTVYKRMEQGLIPQPDGYDMPNRPEGQQGRPYWHTATIRPLLEPKVS